MAITLLVLAGSWFLWKRKTDGLTSFDLVLTWAIKILASTVFLFIYTHYYGNGTLTADPNAFMEESRLLHAIANESIGDYLRFLFGLETQEMVNHYLIDTTHWNTGDLTLINDSKNVIRMNSILYFISNGNVYFNAFVFSFFSLLGFRELYLTFHKSINFSKRRFWYALILLPSILFWTASMLKEPFMMVGFCLLLRAVLGELTLKQRVWRFILGVVLMIAFKPYVLLCLIPAVLIYCVAKWVFKGRIAISMLSVLGLLILFLTIFPKQRDKGVFYLTRKQFDFINIGSGGMHAYADTCFYFFRPDQFQYLTLNRQDSSIFLTKGLDAKKVELGKALPFKDVTLQPNKKRWILYFVTDGCASYVPVTFIDGSFSQLIKNIPEAFINAAFRPFFGDPGGWLKYFAVIETLLLFGWAIFSFRYWKGASPEIRLQVITLLVFSVALLILIGWITPVLGAIVRYRIPAYMAILVASLLLFKQKKELKHE